MKEVKLFDDALEDLSELPHTIQTRIVNKIENYAEGKSADIKKLVNRNDYRLRVGDYRVLFYLNDEKIEIHRILHRNKVYKV